MRSIIEELWMGNICPQEDGLYSAPQMRELVGYEARHRADLEKTLSEEQKEILQKWLDCRNEFDGLAERAVFLYAFRLGARLVMDVVRE